jgi:hypothetical protein
MLSLMSYCYFQFSIANNLLYKFSMKKVRFDLTRNKLTSRKLAPVGFRLRQCELQSSKLHDFKIDMSNQI